MNFRQGLIFGIVTANVFFGRYQLPAAATGDDPYADVPIRNIFGLQPRADATTPPASTVPAASITPNGIMTIFGKSQVLFKVSATPVPGQPPPKEQSFILSEGERQDDIEVQKIDAQAALITFNNHGTIQKLSLAAGGAKGGPASAAPIGVPRRRFVSARLPGVDATRPANQAEYFRNLGIIGNPGHFTGPDGDPMATDPASDTTLGAPADDSAASRAYGNQPIGNLTPAVNGSAGNSYSTARLSAQQDAAGGDVPDGGDSPLPPGYH